MKIQDILSKKVDIFSCAKKSSRVWYSNTLLYFLNDLSKRYKKQIGILREINKTDEKTAKEYKKEELICCTISAKFETYRLIHKIKERTGLIAIDIDKDKNEGLDVEKAKLDVMKFPFVSLTMLSCRGEGIWCLIPYNKDNDFKETWNSLYDDFKNIGYVIDDCKDETRLRFVTYGTNMLVRQSEREVYNKTKSINKTVITSNNNVEEKWILNKDNIKEISIAIYLLTHYCGYSADEYNEWLLDGFRLATIPNKDIGFKLFLMISKCSKNFESDIDVKEKFDECCRTTTYTTSILGYYINRIKEHYGNEWKNIAIDKLGPNCWK